MKDDSNLATNTFEDVCKLVCSLCDCIVYHPYNCSKMHHYHFDCIKDKSFSLECPKDKEKVGLTDTSAKFYFDSRMCLNQAKGCRFEGTLLEVAKHLRVCFLNKYRNVYAADYPGTFNYTSTHRKEKKEYVENLANIAESSRKMTKGANRADSFDEYLDSLNLMIQFKNDVVDTAPTEDKQPLALKSACSSTYSDVDSQIKEELYDFQDKSYIFNVLELKYEEPPSRRLNFKALKRKMQPKQGEANFEVSFSENKSWSSNESIKMQESAGSMAGSVVDERERLNNFESSAVGKALLKERFVQNIDAKVLNKAEMCSDCKKKVLVAIEERDKTADFEVFEGNQKILGKKRENLSEFRWSTEETALKNEDYVYFDPSEMRNLFIYKYISLLVEGQSESSMGLFIRNSIEKMKHSGELPKDKETSIEVIKEIYSIEQLKESLTRIKFDSTANESLMQRSFTFVKSLSSPIFKVFCRIEGQRQSCVLRFKVKNSKEWFGIGFIEVDSALRENTAFDLFEEVKGYFLVRRDNLFNSEKFSGMEELQVGDVIELVRAGEHLRLTLNESVLGSFSMSPCYSVPCLIFSNNINTLSLMNK